MPFRTILRGRFAVVVVVVSVCGCGNRMSPIKGTVTIDGKSVGAGTTVMFSAEGETRPATGVTDENGSFVLSTNQTADGVMHGEYKVVIINRDNYVETPRNGAPSGRDGSAFDAHRIAMDEMRNQPPKPGALPLIYSNPATTPLRFRAPEDGSEAVFDLKSGVAPTATGQ